MGHMKEYDIRLRNGGDDAVAAAAELSQLTWHENQRLRLTDAERKAVQYFAALTVSPRQDDYSQAVVLRGLLDRLGHQ